MYNILVVSHYNLAECLIETIKGITGVNTENMFACGLQFDEKIDAYAERLLSMVDSLYKDKQLLIFADIYGGTPCNSVIANVIYKYKKVKVITGVNLPMLLEAYICSTNMPLESVVDKLSTLPQRTILRLN